MQSGDRITINDRSYQIGSVLSTGAGSYGQVWAATDVDGRAVALKIINTEVMAQADPILRSHWRAHLEREIDFFKQLSAAPSRHIVTLIDHGQVDDQQPVLVLERLQANLGQWLTQQRRDNLLPDLAQILDWTGQILQGLDTVHRAGFVYRDLKFSNILVGEDGALLKLADFGSLKCEDGDNTCSFIGTPATMAPEQALPACQGADGYEYAVDYRVDYYALGLLLFTLITDRPATAAQRRLGQLLALHGQEGASQQREQLGGLDDEEWQALQQSIEFWTIPALSKSVQNDAASPLAHLIARLLARNPDERPSDSLEIRVVLDAMRATQPSVLTLTPEWSTPLPNEPLNWRPHRNERRVPPSRQRLALLALGLAGAVAWAMIRPPSDEMRPFQTTLSPKAIPVPPAIVAIPPEPATTPTRQAELPAAIIIDQSSSKPSVSGTDQAALVQPTQAEPQPALEPSPESSPAPPAIVATPTAPPPPRPVAPPRYQPHTKNKSDKSSTTVVTRDNSTIRQPKTIAKPSAAAERPTEPPPVPPHLVATPKIAKPAPKPSFPTAPSAVHRSTSVAKVKAAPTPARDNPASNIATAHPPVLPSSPAKPDTKPEEPVVGVEPRTPPDLPPIEIRARPLAAPSAPPTATIKSRPIARVKPRLRPTPPNLPPIEMRARPLATPSVPPIELVSRSNATPASTRPAPPAASVPTAERTVSPTLKAGPSPSAASSTQSADFLHQFQNDAGRAATTVQRQAESFTRWVNRTSATVGKEVQRGLETADRTVGQWTGRCNQPGGCGRKAPVERRDRWSSRYGGEPVKPHDTDLSNPSARQPQAYR